MLYWECQDFQGALPSPGGLLQQSAGLIKRMRKAYQVWTVYNQWRLAGQIKNGHTEFKSKYPDAYKLKIDIDKARDQWQTVNSE